MKRSKKNNWLHQWMRNSARKDGHYKHHGWSPEYIKQVKDRTAAVKTQRLEAVEKQRELAKSFSVMRAGGLASRRARSSGLV